jgi:hypothetical protein
MIRKIERLEDLSAVEYPGQSQDYCYTGTGYQFAFVSLQIII